MSITANATGIIFNSGRSKSTSTNQFGVGQSWQSVSRGLDTTYTNSTSRPILVIFTVRGENNNNSYVRFYVNDGVNGDIEVGAAGSHSATRDGIDSPICAIVPVGYSYQCVTQVGGPSLQLAYEFR